MHSIAEDVNLAFELNRRVSALALSLPGKYCFGTSSVNPSNLTKKTPFTPQTPINA